jgi:hypothetical protein
MLAVTPVAAPLERANKGCRTRTFLASNTMRRYPCYLRLHASLMMATMTGKTNVRPVDGPAVTDRDKH